MATSLPASCSKYRKITFIFEVKNLRVLSSPQSKQTKKIRRRCCSCLRAHTSCAACGCNSSEKSSRRLVLTWEMTIACVHTVWPCMQTRKPILSNNHILCESCAIRPFHSIYMYVTFRIFPLTKLELMSTIRLASAPPWVPVLCFLPCRRCCRLQEMAVAAQRKYKTHLRSCGIEPEPPK